MLEGFGARSGEKGNLWKLVLSVILLVIAVYELLGVIYVRVSQRPFEVEYTKLLQSLVSLFLVIYLVVTVWVIGTFFRDDTSCLLLSNVMWFSYLVLSTLVHIFYYMKQRVLSTAIDMKTIFWWLRPLLGFCIFLIIFTLGVGTWTQFPISKSYVYENNICVACSTVGVTIVLMYMFLDCFSVVLLLMLFVLPLWRFMGEDNYITQSKNLRLRRALIRNVVLCSIAVFTTIVAWVAIVVLGNNCVDTSKSIDLSSQSLIWATEQFVICNCILRTMTEWKKYLLWPFVLFSKTDPTSNSSNSNMKDYESVHNEFLLSPVNSMNS